MVASLKSKNPPKRKRDGSLTALPPYLSSKLRIFFTADIVGSTNYKQKNAQRIASFNKRSEESPAQRKEDLHPKWFASIAEFYSQTQKSLTDEWNDLRHSVKNDKDLSQDIGDAPAFWKTIGDEICFSKLITSDVCLLATVQAWTGTLVKVRKMLKVHDPDLDVKSSAWLAGFPIHNTEIILAASSKSDQSLKDEDDDFVYNALLLLEKYYEKQGADGLTQDFVGPSIDTGFRIASHSTPRKMTISVELAYMCAEASLTLKHHKKGGHQPTREHLVDVTFGYDGRKPLKGVMGGSHYPILWLDLDTSDGEASQLNDSESTLLNNSLKGKTKEFRDFCENFIDHNPAYLCKPYILDNTGKVVFGKVPSRHEEQKQRLLKIADWFAQEKSKLKQEDNLADKDLLKTGTALKAGDKIQMA